MAPDQIQSPPSRGWTFLVFTALLLLPFVVLSGCGRDKGWVRDFSGLQVYSSPRLVDLDGDGVLDVVVGMGRREFLDSDTAVVALSGANGEVLWSVPARDEVFGSAEFLDINGDGVPEVLIGGRAATFLALDGRDGTLLWEYREKPPADGEIPGNWNRYNFYNAQILPDLTGDGVQEILLSAGGGGISASPDPRDRYPGKLLILDSSTGQELVSHEMSDGKETYMTPLVADLAEGEELSVIFGTGGETIGGSLFRIPLRQFIEAGLSGAVEVAVGEKGGFIAPPTLADLDGDGVLDIVAIDFSCRIVAVSGRDNRLLWENRIGDLPGPLGPAGAYASLSPGRFTGDEVPDFVTVISRGIFPHFDKSLQIGVDGRTGEVFFRDSLNVGFMSSPVVADLTGDGRDDALISINMMTVREGIPHYENLPVVYDFRNGRIFQLQSADRIEGINLASTPWIGDLDGDGKMDLIQAVSLYPPGTGSRIERVSTGIVLDRQPVWGGYMGSRHDGVWRPPVPW